MEFKFAEMVHEALVKECKTEDELKMENIRHQLHIDSIKSRQEEYDKNRAMTREDTQNHIAWAEQDNRERGYC